MSGNRCFNLYFVFCLFFILRGLYTWLIHSSMQYLKTVHYLWCISAVSEIGSLREKQSCYSQHFKNMTNRNVVVHQAYRNPRNQVRALVGLVSSTSVRQVHTLSKQCSAALFLLTVVRCSSLMYCQQNLLYNASG